MRSSEFVRESMGGTVAGAVASVSQPMGELITRENRNKKTKYSNAANKPWPTRNTKHARR